MKSKRNPNHIAGIYNYCDRWCERCAFTAKCAVYENTSNLTPGQNDISNKAFWDNLSNNFTDAIQMLADAAKKHGIEIQPLTEQEEKEFKTQKDAGRAKADKEPVIQLAKKYSKIAIALLEKSELLKQSAKEILEHTQLGIKTIAQAKQEVADLNDCLEVVQWYIFQVHVKFLRAMPMNAADKIDKFFTNDSNGSAKVALIAADRSLLAWQKILQILPDTEDDILPLLSLLQQIQAAGEKKFPGARKFKRPGLD